MEEDPTEGQPPRFSSRAQRAWVFMCPSALKGGAGLRPAGQPGAAAPTFGSVSENLKG